MSPTKSRSRRALYVDQAIAMVLAFLLVSILGGVLTAALVIPGVAVTGQVTSASTDLFEDLPTELAIPQASEQSRILAADGSQIATFFAENRIVVEQDQIDPVMAQAVVAIEDERFFEHNGIDLQGIARAAVNNLTGGALAGGSTLTQQYVKNLRIEQGRITGDQELIEEAVESSIGRKLAEARMAIALEQQQTKDQVLTGYLNIAQFGPSVYGVEAASRHYFNHSADELSVGEAALLAGITQSPARWDPVAHPDNADDRQHLVLDNMLRLGFITEAEHEEADSTPIEAMLDVQNTPNGCAAAGSAAYFCDYVVKDLLANEEWGSSLSERQSLLYRGGLTIRTTLDPRTQQIAYEEVTNAVPVTDPSDIRMALTAVQPGTGHIQAMAQNTNYGPPTETDPDGTLINLNVGQSRGGGQGFQTGSLFKVFTLAQWLIDGNSLHDQVSATDREFPAEEWNISCGRWASDYGANNLETGLGAARGNVTVLEATARSINTPFIEMGVRMDLCDMIDTAEAMGLETQGDGSPMEPNPSSILGSNYNTPLQIATASATLAAGGVHCDPVAVLEATDGDGNPIPLPATACERVLDEQVAADVTVALNAVVSPQMTGFRAILADGRPAAGKTGTANRDSAAWFMGYTPQLATAVWMGHMDSNISMFDSVIDGEYHPEVYGGLYPAATFSAFTSRALEGVPIEPFPQGTPRTADRAAQQEGEDDEQDEQEQNQQSGEPANATVPAVTGQSQADAAANLQRAGFQVALGAPQPSDLPPGAVMGSSPGEGAGAAPGSIVTLFPSAGPGTEVQPEGEPPSGEG